MVSWILLKNKIVLESRKKSYVFEYNKVEEEKVVNNRFAAFFNVKLEQFWGDMKKPYIL